MRIDFLNRYLHDIYAGPEVEVRLDLDWHILKAITRIFNNNSIRAKMYRHSCADSPDKLTAELCYWKNYRQKDIDFIEGIIGKKSRQELIGDGKSIVLDCKDVYELYKWAKGYSKSYEEFCKECFNMADGRIVLHTGTELFRRYIEFTTWVLSGSLEYKSDDTMVNIEAYIFSEGNHANKGKLYFYICPRYKYINTDTLKTRSLYIADRIRDAFGLSDYTFTKENEFVYAIRFDINDFINTFGNMKTYMRMRCVSKLIYLIV